jgi:hypothetical protein
VGFSSALSLLAFGVTPVPAQQASPPTAQPAPAPSKTAVLWVNTVSGFYHQPGSRHYGKAKHGKYLSEADAIRAGYRRAQN